MGDSYGAMFAMWGGWRFSGICSRESIWEGVGLYIFLLFDLWLALWCFFLQNIDLF